MTLLAEAPVAAANDAPLDDTGTRAAGPVDRTRRRLLKPGWPLAAIFVPFPLWWALGLSEWACVLLAVPMVFSLVRQRRITVPRSFGWWLLFLAWVGIGVVVLHVPAYGAVVDHSATRYITWAYRLAWYLAITVAGLYVLNKKDEISTTRIARIVSCLFLTIVAGGLLGVFAPHVEFTSLMELVLPRSVTQNSFVNHMIHPTAAQLQDVLGFSAPRPSAPYSYTNIWGLNYVVTLPFFVYAWCRSDAGWRRFVAPVVLLVSAVPVIYSINRGMWAALVVMALFVAARAALSGRPGLMGGVVLAGVAVILVVATTSLSGVVEARFSNSGSAVGRTNLGTLSVTSVTRSSPIVGLGSTRNVQGNFNTITGGATADCPRCSPPALGTQGQLWLVVFSQGLVGLILYLGFFGLTFVRSRRSRAPVVTMGLSVLVASFVTMPFYNALGTGLMVVMIAVALMAREEAVDGARLPTLATYFGPMRRHVAVIALCALIGLDGAALWQQARGVPYVASETLLVPAGARLPSGGDGPMTLDTEVQGLASPAVADAVEKATGRTLTPTSNDLRAVAVPNSRVLRLNYEADDAKTATAGVRAASDAFLSQRQQQLDKELADEIASLKTQAEGLDTSVRVLGDALAVVGDTNSPVPTVQTRNTREQLTGLLTRIDKVNYQLTHVLGNASQTGGVIMPTKVVPQNKVWNVSLASGLMLGLLAGVGMAMVLDHRGRRLRTPDDVQHGVGIPVLAVIDADAESTAGTSKRRLGRRLSRSERNGDISRAQPLEQAALAVTVYGVDEIYPVTADETAQLVARSLRKVVAREAYAAAGVRARHRADGPGEEWTRVAVVIPYAAPADVVSAACAELARVGHVVVGGVLCR